MSFVIYFEYLFLYSFCCLLWFSNSIFYLYLSFLRFMYYLLRHVWIQWDEGIPFCLHSISKFMQSGDFISFLAGSLPIDALSEECFGIDLRHVRHQCHFNSIDTTGFFLCPLKRSENRRFLDDFRGYRKRPVA